MIRAHRDAVVDFLEGLLPGAVFTSFDATELSRYAVVFIARSQREAHRYSGAQARDVFTVTVHSVGVNENSCLWVQERVDRLTDQTLSVSGRRLFPVEYITGQSPQNDDDGLHPLWWTVSQFDIISDPA